MVEIREETSDSEQQQQPQPNQQSTGNAQSTGAPRNTTLLNFAKENASEVFSFLLRLATAYLACCYLFPFSSPYMQKTSYGKAFIAASATNAFRLHQRLRGNTNPFFSRQFLNDIFLEDSAHYLFYCFIFVTSSPVTMAILPITLYAFLHSLNFGIKAASELGYGNSTLAVKATQLKTQHTSNILSTIACAEIFVFPIVVAMVFMGKASFFVPFVYYRFLTLRYLSRRNPYTRTTFVQMKLSLYEIAGHNSCPQLLKNVIYKSISIIERLAPQ